MKKLFALFLVCFSLLGLAACEGFDINGLLGGLPGNTAVATQEQLDEAAEMLYVYNKPGENNQLASDLQRLSILDYDGVIFSVKWEVEGAGDNVVIVENDDDTVTIDVNKYIDHDADVTIKATLTSGTLSKTVEFHYVMKKFVLSTWEQWFDENKQSTGTITIKGVIVAKDVYSAANKNTSLYIEDLDGMGGYMAYRVVCSTQAAYDTDLAIGNIVEITGTASPFNGFREFKAGCTYEVLEGTQTVAPHALDEVIAASSDLKKDLDPYQSMLVSLEGWKVKSVAVQTEFNKETNSGSVNVVLTKGGKEITTRYSTSNTFTYEDVEAAYEKLAVGYTVNVTGVVAWYNTPQIYPLNAASYEVTSTEVNPQDVMNGALEALQSNLKTNFYAAGSAELPTESTGVSLSYEVLGEAQNAVVISENKLVVTPQELPVSATVEITASFMNVEVKKEVVINVIGTKVLTIEEASELAKGSLVSIKATVKSIDTEWSDQYKNISVTVEDATGTLYIFRMKTNVAVGDVIVITGAMDEYDGEKQIAAGATAKKYVEEVPAAPEYLDYSFADLAAGSELTAETALAAFGNSEYIAAIEVSKVYQGNGSGGVHANAAGMIKFGTKSAAGVLKVTLAAGLKISKIEVKVHDFYGYSADHPTNSNTISVNGGEAKLAPYNETGAHEVMTFELNAANYFEIVSGNRITVTGIKVYLEQPEAVESNVVYSFADLAAGSELTAETALAAFGNSELISAIEVSKVYQGNGSGGVHANAAGMIKFGSKSTAGNLKVTLAEGLKISKIEVKVHDFYGYSADHPTNSNTISVNGGEAKLAPYNETGAHEVMTFELNGANYFEIVSGKRITVTEIKVYYTK